MVSNSKKITVLVPAYNESASLPLLVRELDSMADGLPRYDWEYLFVNDGSRDNTLDVLAKLRTDNPRVSYLNLSRNFGKENALLAGMDYATGDAVVIMDADLQHPVDAIPDFIARWEDGYDDVYGRRLDRGKESWLRRQLSLQYYRFLEKTSRIEMLRNVGDFRLLDRRVVDALRSMRETDRYTKGLYCWAGYRKTGVDYTQKGREQGVSSFNLMRLVNLAIDGLTGFSTAPLRIATIIGLLVSLLSFLYLIYIVVKTMIYDDPVAGFPTLVCLILFLGGLQLLALGIIGEYVGKIFNQSRNRPIYIAENYNGKKI